MSTNRLQLDGATYRRELGENASMLNWVLDQAAYEHPAKRRHELGLVAGPAVSHVSGNLVDLSSDLRGQTRYVTWCPANQHKPHAAGELILNDKTPPIDTRPLHLRPTQFFGFPEVPLPPPAHRAVCRFPTL